MEAVDLCKTLQNTPAMKALKTQATQKRKGIALMDKTQVMTLSTTSPPTQSHLAALCQANALGEAALKNKRTFDEEAVIQGVVTSAQGKQLREWADEGRHPKLKVGV